MRRVDADQVLAFRLARSGLAARRRSGIAQVAACPASDFARDAALLALAARVESISRDAYDSAADSGMLLVAHVVRGAIHALRPADHALWGRALLARDDDELAAQMGQQVRRLLAKHDLAAHGALQEVADATKEALARGRKLDRVELHEELRARVRDELMPWCRGCGSNHVAPMLWRFATVKAGVRLDSERRYLMSKPGRAPRASEALRRYLGFYGPARPGEFADWAGIARPQTERLWAEVESDLAEVDGAWLLKSDLSELESPPAAEGVRLLPAGDPYLQKPNRPLLARDESLRKRLFRPVASPGAVLKDGRLVGIWKAKAKGGTTEIAVEKLGRVARGALEEEARRMADLRGTPDVKLMLA
jgi:hypothetical protein